MAAHNLQLQSTHPTISCLGDDPVSLYTFSSLLLVLIQVTIESLPMCKVDRQKHNYDKTTSTVQLMLGDTVLKKADVFQGKRKVKDQWSEVEYEVIRQVTNGVPSYEIKDSSSNVKVTHHN